MTANQKIISTRLQDPLRKHIEREALNYGSLSELYAAACRRFIADHANDPGLMLICCASRGKRLQYLAPASTHGRMKEIAEARNVHGSHVFYTALVRFLDARAAQNAA